MGIGNLTLVWLGLVLHDFFWYCEKFHDQIGLGHDDIEILFPNYEKCF